MTKLGDHYFSWYANDGTSHLIHVCFRGNDETGKFECCQWNTSGFERSEWENIDIKK